MNYSAWLEDGKKVPLVVDFDGTMHDADLNVLGFKWLGWRRFLVMVKLVGIWFLQGKAAMKLAFELLALAEGWAPNLVWHPVVLELMVKAVEQGRKVVVVTGSAQRLVEGIIRQNALPYAVVGTSDKRVNLVAEHKAAALVAKYGEQGFDYIGNSWDDVKVWKHARKAVVVGAGRRLRVAVLRVMVVEKVLFLDW